MPAQIPDDPLRCIEAEARAGKQPHGVAHRRLVVSGKKENGAAELGRLVRGGGFVAEVRNFEQLRRGRDEQRDLD